MAGDNFVSEARTFTVLSLSSTATVATSGRVFGVYNFPTPEENVSQARVILPVKRDSAMDVSGARVFAVIRGRTDTPRVRVWTFALDGHDFYVIRLGDAQTLVYDLTTEQWMRWTSEDLPFWRANTGDNWIGMESAAFYGGATSKVVVGDDTFGLLWTLDPNIGYDESPRSDRPNLSFPRKVVGGVPMRMRETLKTGAVYLTANVATPQLTGASISLRTSDDAGATWTEQGTITVEPGNYDQEFVWRSLGLIKAPGRIFEVRDDGATVRLDGLDMR